MVLESVETDQAQPMQRLFAPLGRCDAADRQRKLDIAQRSKPWKQIAVLGDVADAGVQAKRPERPCRRRHPDAAIRPEASRSNVVLPQPDGPTTVVIFPGGTSKLTPSSASTSCCSPANASRTSANRIAGGSEELSRPRAPSGPRIASLRCHTFIRCNCGRSPMILVEPTCAISTC